MGKMDKISRSMFNVWFRFWLEPHQRVTHSLVARLCNRGPLGVAIPKFYDSDVIDPVMLLRHRASES